MADPTDTALIALDWGTTACRAYRLDSMGGILERRSAAQGILAVEDGAFPAAMQAQIGDWRAMAPTAPLLASGMIGSRQGWIEVPYCQTPATIETLAAGLGRAPLPDGGALHVVPGVLSLPAADAPDVMRGEETQVIGALAERATVRCCILPGTHSKWVRLHDGAILDFATFMTGEVFGVLKAHSILGRTMQDGDFVMDAFARGVTAGLAAKGLLHTLFGVRTLALQERLSAAEGPDYLSGLLIGAELCEGLAWLQGDERPELLIGEGVLCRRYAEALALAGIDGVSVVPDAAAAGLFLLARAARLIDP